MSELTARQWRFVTEYLIDLNGTQAAIRAGFSPKGADVTAIRLLGINRIAEEIAKHNDKRAKKVGLEAEGVLDELRKIVYGDTRKLYKEDGVTLKQPHEWDDDTAACVSGVEVTEEFAGRGEERELVGYTKRVKQWDKLAAIEKAMKHLGLFEKDNNQRTPNLSMQIVAMGVD